MKRKDVEKLLKKEVNAFDDHDSLAEIKSRLGMEDTHAHVQRDGSVAVTRRRNRFVVIIAAFAAAVAIAVMAIAFWPRGNTTPSGPSFPVFSGKNDLYALAGISTGELLTEMSGATASAALASSRSDAGYGQEASDELVAELDEYMQLVDTLINAAASKIEFEELTEGEYRYRSVTTVATATGETVTYTMLYNEDVIEEELGGGEEERETRIEGVMRIGGNEFPFDGKRETENEDGESEMELELTTYLDARGSGTFVRFQQEIENDEQAYAYEIYKNGRLSDEFELEIENENNETEISLEKNGVKYELKEQKRGGSNVITVEYENGGKRYRLVAVPQENGKYKYYHND